MRGLLLIAASLAGCGADAVAPTVSIVAQAPAALVIGVDEEDDISLRLAYQDGDGDLGGGSLVVHDCRDAATRIALPIPPVASPEIVENQQPISGELIALIPDIREATEEAVAPAICAGVTQRAGELVVCVTIEDSAGLTSERACSAPFALASP